MVVAEEAARGIADILFQSRLVTFGISFSYGDIDFEKEYNEIDELKPIRRRTGLAVIATTGRRELSATWTPC